MSKGGLANILTRAYAADFPTRDPVRCFLYQQISGLNTHVPSNLLQVLLTTEESRRCDRRAAHPDDVAGRRRGRASAARTVMEMMAQRIPHARFVKVPGAGHSVYFEKPDDFNRIVGDFLSEAGVR